MGSNMTVCTVHGIIGTNMQAITKNFGVYISKHVLEIQGEENYVKGSYTHSNLDFKRGPLFPPNLGSNFPQVYSESTAAG